MRTKPIRREEVRFDGERITTMRPVKAMERSLGRSFITIAECSLLRHLRC